MKVLKTHTFTPPPTDNACRRLKGSGILIIAIVTAIIVAGMSFSMAKLNRLAYQGFNNSKVMLQAQQYADSEAAIIKATNYSDLTAHNKAAIQNSKGFYSEITLSSESAYSENIKQRNVSINIYKDNEALPRFSLNVRKTNVEEGTSGGVPVGTIIAWASATAPTEGGTWLLCNGQSCSAYPKLVALIGNSVPSLNERFLEGTTGTPRIMRDAGLPNITGTFGADDRVMKAVGGAFYQYGRDDTGSQKSEYGYVIGLDASRSSSVYGKSSTVQPKSYLVRYYIKAA